MKEFIAITTLLFQNIYVWLVLGFSLCAFLKVKESLVANFLKYFCVRSLLPLFIFFNMINHLEINALNYLYHYIIWSIILFITAEVYSRVLSKKFCPQDFQQTYLIGNCNNNFGYIAFGLITLLYGHEVVVELFFFTITSEILMWTRGLSFLNPNALSLKSILQNPPLLAFISSFILVLCGMQEINQLSTFKSMSYLINLIFLPIVFIGMGALIFHLTKGLNYKDIILPEILSALILRHILIPMTIIPLCTYLCARENLKKSIQIEAMMPMSMMVVTIAHLYGGDSKKLGLTMIISQLVCLITIPFWLLICEKFFP